MAQVDIITYFPSLFWFVLNFLLLYILIVVYVLPIVYSGLKVRTFLLLKLENLILFSDNFLNTLNIQFTFLYKHVFFNKYIGFLFILILRICNFVKLGFNVRKSKCKRI
jgi:hypothetical protein